MNSNFKEFYEGIYDILQKYKDDAVFLKAIPQTKEMIDALEEDEDLFEKKFFTWFSTECQDFCFFVRLFEKNKDDIKWYYENRGNYIRERLRYEYLDIDGEYKSYYNVIEDTYDLYIYSELDEILLIYNGCIAGGYGDAISCLCGENWFFILTHDTCDDKELSVKYALTYLTEYINSRYDKYKNEATKNRNIFKEIDEHISMLSDYAKDSVFLNEVPNIFEIIENLKSAKGKDEDEAYKIFWQLSNIRTSINLYKKNRDDMKFFYDNRDISKFVPKDNYYMDDKYEYCEENYNPYINSLYDYIKIFERSLTFANCWRRITRTTKITEDKNKSTKITLEFNKESMEEFIKWVINEINEYFK